METAAGNYRDYREYLATNQMPRALRTALYCAIGAIVAFVPLDFFAFNADWLPFLLIRGFAATSVLAIYRMLRVGSPEACGLWIVSIVGGMLLLVIESSGGVESDYYAGLVLLLSAIPVILPVTASQMIFLSSALLLGFVSIGLSNTGFGSREAVTHVVILSTSGAISTAAAHMLDGVRFAAHQRQMESEAARDRLAELDVAKSRFTANVHHELRTPLTLMLVPLEAIRSGDLGDVPSNIDRTLRIMQSNGLRLLRLINNLLDLAKIESEQLEIRRSILNPIEAIGAVVLGAQSMAERKNVSLRVDAPEVVDGFYADPEALEKIAVNLVGNALKFTDGGAVTVSVRAAARDEGVHFSVQDSGMGIPAGQLEMIFDRFAQVDASATRRHEGSGIGLSLVRELVSLHGGRVWAESGGVGQGTTVHFVLPYGQPDGAPDEQVLISEADGRLLDARRSIEVLAIEEPRAFDQASADRDGQSAELERSVQRWEGMREQGPHAPDGRAHAEGTPEVVVADDNGEMRELLCFLIGREFVVRPCRNGREALEAVRERQPMLVVTDVMMPEMSGTELCAAIKDDPELRGVPVMLVTSKAEREMKIEGLEMGADDYVTKPFHPRELLARVRSLVRVRQLQEEVAAQNEVLERSNAELEQALADLKDAEVQLVQSERLAAVGELSAGVAHEVNNPLNYARNSLAALRAYVQDLQDVAAAVGRLDASDPRTLGEDLAALERKKTEVRFDELSDDLSELVQIVTEGLDRTSRLVGDLRDFAAPHRGARVAVDLNASVESTLQLTGYKLRESRCEVVTELAEGLSPVLGDPSALNQVFLNLLKNAAEAIDGMGGGTLTVATAELRGHVQVLVRDDGPGMDSKVKSRLFEPFFTTKEAGEGTGLGLSMCRRIVAEHGGEIAVESEPGVGTTVVVRLPVHAGSAARSPDAV